MASLPRILTVDPYGNIPAQVRAAFELMDRYVTQIDVPNADVALEEFERGGIDAVIAAWTLGEKTQGWELAAKLKQVDENVSVIILGNYDDTGLDDEMLEQSPFVYLRRPLDIPQLIRVLRAALDGGNIFDAAKPPVTAGIQSVPNMGPVPNINIEKAGDVLTGLVSDINPMSAILATREGQIVLEQGFAGDLETGELARTVVHAILANIDLRDYIGGNATALQFFDGDDYDVFLLSVGLHHFLMVVFDGASGARQLGAVNRYGRKRAEDLIGVLGAGAWIIQRPTEPDEKDVLRRSTPRVQEEEQRPELERAKLTSEVPAVPEDDFEELASVMPQLEAIADDDFNIDDIFGDMGDGDADDIFSLDAMAEIAQEIDTDDGSTLDMDKARTLGLIDMD